MDFSENYSFLIQDAIQAHHWDNSQATLHVYVTYHKENDILKHDSFVVISESLKHSAASVNLYNKKLILYLKTKFGDSAIKKIYYISDGAPSQYKNKHNLAALLCHEAEWGINAEWHFFATAHGKGACDGVGGSIKNAARTASLQRNSKNQITSPKHLFEWAITFFKNIDFYFCTIQEYQTHEKSFLSKHKNCKALPKTRQFHAFIPVLGKKQLMCKIFSDSKESEIVGV